jgi:hypothetical protein
VILKRKIKRKPFKYTSPSTRNDSEVNQKGRVKVVKVKEKQKGKVSPKEDIDHLVFIKEKGEMRRR